MTQKLLTHQLWEDHKAKMLKLRQLDAAIRRTQENPSSKASLQRYYLEKQKQDIRATFPKPKLIKYD